MLVSLGVKRGMVVYGMDKLDEISMSASTKICEIKDGWFRTTVISPEDFGFERCTKEDLKGGTPEENAKIVRDILGGQKGNKRNAVLMNAGASLYIGGKADSMKEGIELAAEIIDSGKALETLDKLIEVSTQNRKGKAMNILDQLAEYSRLRVAEDKKKISLDEIKNIAIQTKNEKLCDFAFEKALKKGGLSFICECKKASPSKGLIEPDFRYLEIAREYEAAGADCISVLTEPKWFLGSDEYLKEIAKTVSIPCIRKDFTVDEYQIYQAKTLGAAAVLLICSILSEEQLGEYIKICDSLGISALVEIHNEKEAGMAVRAGARIIGVNNRNLKDFTVDTANSRKLRDLIPYDIIFVSESGVKSTDDIRAIREIGADAVLIGETLMRADDKKAKLDELRLS